MDAAIYIPKARILKGLGILLVPLAFFLITKLMRQPSAPENIRNDVYLGMSVGYLATCSVPMFKCDHIKLKDFKSPGKWCKQFVRRNFTAQRIVSIVSTGTAYQYIDEKGNSMVRFECKETGDWIVIDVNTCEIYQIAPNYFYHR